MSQISREPQSAPLTPQDVVPPEGGAYAPPSATWQGWAYFGAVIMGLLGFLQALVGLIALVDQEYFTFRENSLLVASSYATWGWAHLIAGLAALAAGAGILISGHLWARATGIVVAALSAV